MSDLIRRERALDDMLFAMAGTGYQSRAMDVIRFCPEVDPEPKWISVKDRLPDTVGENGRQKITETVLAADSCGAVHVGYFTVYKYDGSSVFTGVDVEFFDSSPSDIAYWMPLPEPPKEEA